VCRQQLDAAVAASEAQAAIALKELADKHDMQLAAHVAAMAVANQQHQQQLAAAEQRLQDSLQAAITQQTAALSSLQEQHKAAAAMLQSQHTVQKEAAASQVSCCSMIYVPLLYNQHWVKCKQLYVSWCDDAYKRGTLHIVQAGLEERY